MKSRFAQAVADNSHRQKTTGSTYGHLALPRGVNIFKETPDSKVTLDFLPYVVSDPKHLDRDEERKIAVAGELWYKKPYRLHRSIGVQNQSMVCPATVGKKCPICEFRSKKAKEGVDRDELKDLRASLRNLYVVIPIDHKDYPEKPHIWDISQFLFQDMLNDEISEDPENRGIFPDPEEGLALKIRFGEAQIGKNKFAETSRIDFDERDYKYDEKMLEKVPNLDECLIIPSYEAARAIFYEEPSQGEEESEGESEEEAPIRRPKVVKGEEREEKRPVRRATREEPAEDKEEEEEEEQPVRRATPTPKISRRAAEEEDEEKPVRRVSKTNGKDVKSELVTCSTCKGEGLTAKGKECPVCHGEGVVAPKVSTKSEAKVGKTGSLTCPYGYVFGRDCEQYDECDDCEIWSECFDAHKKLTQVQSAKRA